MGFHVEGAVEDGSRLVEHDGMVGEMVVVGLLP